MNLTPHRADVDSKCELSPRISRGGLLNSTLGPLAALFCVWLVFAAFDFAHERGGAFVGYRSVQTMAVHTASVGVPALGMTIIIIAGGIDLAAGAAMALCATTLAYCLREGATPPSALAAALAVGCLAGAFNGALIGTLRIVPFIVTLGTMMVFQGCGRIIAGDTPVRAHAQTPTWLTQLQQPFPEYDWMLVSPGVWFMILLALVVAAVLRYTVFGRHVFALGSNEATARLCGINVPLTRVAVYTLGGLFAGLGGIYQFATLTGEGDPMAGAGKELRIIAAVVVGGGSLSGGRGSVLGTLSGAAIMAVIDHGCTVLGVQDLYQDLLIGAIIISAVALDQFRQRRLAGAGA